MLEDGDFVDEGEVFEDEDGAIERATELHCEREIEEIADLLSGCTDPDLLAEIRKLIEAA